MKIILAWMAREWMKNGYFWYPVSLIYSVNDAGASFTFSEKAGIFIFMDYLTNCWAYGFRLEGNGKYTIGILGGNDTFKPITDSLAVFLDLYLADAPVLYDWE